MEFVHFFQRNGRILSETRRKVGTSETAVGSDNGGTSQEQVHDPTTTCIEQTIERIRKILYSGSMH